ncbi:hypothetical protein ACFL7M_17790 [Thermodesulfobacteriota bacterium]
MKEEVRKKIEEIIDGINCPKDFKCVEGGFERLCKTSDIGLEQSLVCLECQQLLQCQFAVKYDKTYFCQCPVRVYLAKNLK